IGDAQIDGIAGHQPAHLIAHAWYAPLPEIHRIRREPRSGHRRREGRALFFRDDVWNRHDAVAVRQVESEALRVFVRPVGRDDGDSMTPGELPDDPQAADAAA